MFEQIKNTWDPKPETCIFDATEAAVDSLPDKEVARKALDNGGLEHFRKKNEDAGDLLTLVYFGVIAMRLGANIHKEYIESMHRAIQEPAKMHLKEPWKLEHLMHALMVYPNDGNPYPFHGTRERLKKAAVEAWMQGIERAKTFTKEEEAYDSLGFRRFLDERLRPVPFEHPMPQRERPKTPQNMACDGPAQANTGRPRNPSESPVSKRLHFLENFY